MALTQVQSGLLESGAALENIGTGNITPSYLSTQSQYTGFKNRIINGAMVIDQRNAGAAVAATNSAPFITDRWSIRNNSGGGEFTGQQVTAPTGSKFTKALKFTVTTADASIAAGEYYVARTKIEGFNVADLLWGTAAAAPITISFEVNVSVAGTYSVAVCNSTNNRSFVSTFTVNSENTTETKTITVVGDTSGTWLTDNGIGIDLLFNIGMGSTFTTSSTGSWQGATYFAATGQTQLISTLNATMQITGVQLEKGSTATSFDYRPYGTELALCQRYYQIWFAGWTGVAASSGYRYSSGVDFKTEMRASPNFGVISQTNSARFPSANYSPSTVNQYGGYVFYTAASSGGNDSWTVTGTASAEL
jgi:hypothetical protein